VTNRPLTAAELADARTAYNAIGKLYMPTGAASELVRACCHISEMLQHNTTDGKPLRSERMPTKDDIGKPVKVRTSIETGWISGWLFVGFSVSGSGRFVAESKLIGQIGTFGACIIDEEAAQ
jgi:hypothetical protein